MAKLYFIKRDFKQRAVIDRSYALNEFYRNSINRSYRCYVLSTMSKHRIGCINVLCFRIDQCERIRSNSIIKHYLTELGTKTPNVSSASKSRTSIQNSQMFRKLEIENARFLCKKEPNDFNWVILTTEKHVAICVSSTLYIFSSNLYSIQHSHLKWAFTGLNIIVCCSFVSH